MKQVLWVIIGLVAWEASGQGSDFFGCTGCAHDHGQTAPYITAHVDARIHADEIYDADHSDDEAFNLRTHTHVDIEISPAQDWFIRSRIKLEQAHGHGHEGGEEASPGDRYFNEHLLFFEELMLVYAPENWEFFAGKFNPVSGVGLHAIPGIYGYEIEEEYSVLGRIGAGASYSVHTENFGIHRVRASGFFRDTSVFNQSLINGNDEPDDREDGGIANTHDFSSWAISLSGDNLLQTTIGETTHELDYVLSYVQQDPGEGAENDHANEERVVVGGVYTITVSDDLQVRAVGEYKDIRHVHTHEGEHLRITTGGLGLYYRGWELGGSYSVTDSNEEPNGHHKQASLGYVWPNGFGVHAGWKAVEEEGEETKSAGLTMSYQRSFD